MRLIDCHKAKRAIYQHKTQRLQKETVLKILDSAPTIDAVPVVHGRWEIKLLNDYRKYSVTCSICGWVGIENYDSYDEPSDFNYCPSCGAKMDLIWEDDYGN